jgi:TfoX/Sxy family transcriptional regulator of competence genes
MAFDTLLADRVREYLAIFAKLEIEEKKMFHGLAFLVNGKMCVNVSGQNLMCRFDPAQTEELAEKAGFLPMIMKGKELKGYCYVEPTGFRNKKDFEFWIHLCLDFNDRAKSSKKRTKQ